MVLSSLLRVTIIARPFVMEELIEVLLHDLC